MALSPEDLQFIESQQFNTTQIARLLGIPASLMLAKVEGTSLTYSNIEQEWLTFGWELAFTLLDKLDLGRHLLFRLLGISIHPS